eukprot:3270667-Pyramimonas_sp.AAC.1
MREKALGPNDASVADSLMKLGELEHQMGRDSAAEVAYRRALEVPTSPHSQPKPYIPIEGL